MGIRPGERRGGYQHETRIHRPHSAGPRLDARPVVQPRSNLGCGQLDAEKILVQRFEMSAHGVLSSTNKVFLDPCSALPVQLPLGQRGGQFDN